MKAKNGRPRQKLAFLAANSSGETQAGRARIAEAQRLRWRGYREKVRANARESEGGSEGMELSPGNIVTLR
jgi:hypothetical protein